MANSKGLGVKIISIKSKQTMCQFFEDIFHGHYQFEMNLDRLKHVYTKWRNLNFFKNDKKCEHTYTWTYIYKNILNKITHLPLPHTIRHNKALTTRILTLFIKKKEIKITRKLYTQSISSPYLFILWLVFSVKSFKRNCRFSEDNYFFSV